MKTFMETTVQLSFFGVIVETIKDISIKGNYILGSGNYSRSLWRYNLYIVSMLEFINKSNCYYL